MDVSIFSGALIEAEKTKEKLSGHENGKAGQ
jgi:hypothetical protein